MSAVPLESHAPLPRRLLIADGMNVVRRVYEAARNASAKKAGVHPEDFIETSAFIEGAMDSAWGSVRRAINELEPTHFFGAFDAPGKNWRHEVFPDYKVHRPEPSEQFRAGSAQFIERMNAAGLKSLAVPGFEADDLITTLTARAVLRGFEVIVLSTDKDLTWLLDLPVGHGGLVRIRDHFTPEWRDHAYVARKFSVRPSQVLDLLALMGDDTDGIPGVDGVGPVKAAKLLLEYGSLDGVLAQASLPGGIKGKLGEALVAQAGVAQMSRKLTELRLDAPMGLLKPSDLELPAAALLGQAAKPVEPKHGAAQPPVPYVEPAVAAMVRSAPVRRLHP